MNWYDCLLVAVIAVCTFFAVRSIIRRKKKGGCACSGACSACSGCDKKKK